MNAIDLLTAQHREIGELVERVEQADSPPRLRARLLELADELAVHTAIEERNFDEEVRARRSQDILLEALEQPRGLTRLASELVALDVADESFEPRLEVLEERLRVHFEEAEAALFPKVRRIFDERELEDMGRRLELLADQLRREVRQRRPSAPAAQSPPP